jgi:hypothetical protein
LDKGFAQAVEKGTEAKGVGATTAADRAQIVADVSADLRAGRVTPEKAIDRVIDRILDRQLGADAPQAAREKIAAVLREALASDPLLVEKVRTLGSAP